MNKKPFYPLFVLLSIVAFVSLACGGGYVPLPYVEVGVGNPETNTQVAPAAPATAESVPTAAPSATPLQTEGAPAETAVCRLIHESVLVETMDHVSTSGSHIHVEYWFDGQPEREVILDASKAAGGRYNFTRPLKGWVWEYADCTYDEVLVQVMANIQRRLAGHANNAGYVQYGVPLSGKDKGASWDPNLLFVPVQ